MRSVRRRTARILIVLPLLLLALPVAGAASPATAQSGSPIVAGAEWVAVDEGWTFEHVSLPNTTFVYLEHDLGDLAVPDNLYLMEVATMFRFIDIMGVEGLPELGASDPAADPLWYLRSMQYQGVAHVVLFTVSVTAVPGKGAVEILVTRPDSLATALSSAQQGITAYGAPIMLTRIDASAVLAAGGGQATTPTAPETPPTPTPAMGTTPAVATSPTPSGGLVLPPLGGTTTPAPAPTPTTAPTPTIATGQTVTVAGATITYAGGWVYDTVNSTPDEIAFFDNNAVTEGFYGYRAVPDISGDALLALQQFNDTYLRNFGVANDRVVAEETLPGGQAWVLHTADLQGLPIVVLTYADVTTAPGQFRLQLLVTTAAEFNAALVDVQASIRIDGQPAYAGLDPAALAALLGGAPTMPAAGTTPGTSTTRSVADYRARDAATGCDGIGWVIIDPAQAPATQADRDVHGACVGGATYLATCGQADMAGVPYLQCTVEVTVTGAPMTISAQHITLVDGAGAVYPVDSEITTLMTGVFGLPVLPEATVGPGAPVSGTIFIPLPTDTPAPWVLEVAPETIATTGEAPGALVIEGALQPVD